MDSALEKYKIDSNEALHLKLGIQRFYIYVLKLAIEL